MHNSTLPLPGKVLSCGRDCSKGRDPCTAYAYASASAFLVYYYLTKKYMYLAVNRLATHIRTRSS